MRVYGIRLDTALFEYEAHELIDYITWLPEGSAYWSVLAGDGDEGKARELFGWTRTQELARVQANADQFLLWAFIQSNSKKRTSPPQEIKGPLGGKSESAKPKADASSFARALLNQQIRGG